MFKLFLGLLISMGSLNLAWSQEFEELTDQEKIEACEFRLSYIDSKNKKIEDHQMRLAIIEHHERPRERTNAQRDLLESHTSNFRDDNRTYDLNIEDANLSKAIEKLQLEVEKLTEALPVFCDDVNVEVE